MSHKQKKKLYLIIITTVLLIAINIFKIPFKIEFTFYIVIYLLIGLSVLYKSAKNITHGQVFDENFLMSIATIGALALGEYNEAIFVMLFYQVGSLFESYAVGKSRKSISDLMDIRPEFANIMQNDEIIQVDPEEINIDDIIIIKPGEKVPLDGIVTEGITTVNTSALTGESVPRDINTGDTILSGYINNNGILKVKVTKKYEDSTVSKILELVENSVSRKAKTENFITKFAKIYTPAVVISAILLAVIPPLLFSQLWSVWIQRALVFLVVSCPCALVISVPMSFFGGIGAASKAGILIKGSTYIEALSKAKVVVFDKTGTLTKGNFKVTAIHPQKISENELLDIAVLAETYSDHPVSVSLTEAVRVKPDKNRIISYEEIPGHGIKAVIDGKDVAVGNAKMMDLIGSEWHDCKTHKGTIIHISVDKEYAGHIVISDEIKENSKAAIKSLKHNGIVKTVMLTGDKKSVGENVGKTLEIDEVYAELLPSEKVSTLEHLLDKQNKNETLIFVGDGINDAPVLTRADIGIAMGALGSDAAVEAADVVLMDDNPKKISDAIGISRRTMSIVKQNIIFALTIKFVALILGALGYAEMWLAVFADVGVSVIAIINAMRTLKYKFKD